ncbi:MAG TPA: ATP-binding protein, partial [Chloroflexota bacterium]|nr:ATP-binding protein [Chloroflexota bacterium]
AGPTANPLDWQSQAAFLFIAFGFVITGTVVLVLTSDALTGWLFLAWTASAAAALAAAVAQISGARWPFVLLYYGLAGFGLTTAALFLTLPISGRRPRLATPLLGAAGTLHAALAGAYIWCLASNPGAYDVVKTLEFVLLAGDMTLAIARLAGSLLKRFRDGRAIAGEHLVLVLAVTGGLGPFALLSLLPYVLGFGYLISPDVAVLSLVLLPLGLAASISRGEILGIRGWLRRGLIRLFVWGVLLVLYGFLLAADALWAAGQTGLAQVLASPFVLVLVVGTTLPRLEGLLRNRLERALLQDVYSLPAALQRFTSEIVHLSTADDVASYGLHSLGETLDLEWTALILPGAEPRLYSWGACPPTLLRATPEADGQEAREEVVGATLVVPLTAGGMTMGTLATGPKRHEAALQSEDRALIATVGPLLAICLQLARQLGIVAQREEELRQLNQRMMDVQEDALRAIALELHDDALQRAIALDREMENVWTAQAREWGAALGEIVITLRSVCLGLYPTILEDLGLIAGLDQLVRELRVQTDIVADMIVSGPDGAEFGRLDREIELALYRVAQEALTNVRKHSGAQHVMLAIHRRIDHVELIVEDDGYTANTKLEQRRGGLGIAGMRHRLTRWGGTLSILDRDGHGTQVRAESPLLAAAAPPTAARTA